MCGSRWLVHITSTWDDHALKLCVEHIVDMSYVHLEVSVVLIDYEPVLKLRKSILGGHTGININIKEMLGQSGGHQLAISNMGYPS